MRRTSLWGWKYAGWILLTLFVLVFIALPISTTYLFKNQQQLPAGSSEYLLWAEELMTFLMVGFVAIWTFFVGSTFASFLNVVAWRVPRGRSILGSSHCPFCDIQLTFRDNVPILGWLKNAGRCANCHLPIGPRYLIVELVLGAIFMIATFTLLLSAGGVLPFVSRTPSFSGFNGLLLDPKLDFVLVLIFHLTALMSIFTFGLIEVERKQIPFSVFGFSAFFLLLLSAIWPQSLVVPWDFPFSTVENPIDRVKALISVGIGAAAGLVSGLLLIRLVQTDNKVHYGFSLIGMIAGWQSVFVVALLWLLSRVCLAPYDDVQIERNNGVESEQRIRELTVLQILGLPHARMLLVLLVHLATWRWFEAIEG